MNKILHSLHTHTELYVFFCIAAASLFIGDGKQSYIEMYWSLGALSLWVVFWYRGRRLLPLPGGISSLWILALGYYIVHTFFSASVGYSIHTTVRLIDAYILFRLAYSLAEEKTIHVFSRMLLVFGIVASAAAAIVFFVSGVGYALPSVNLLSINNGHNHLADILILLLPIVLTLKSPINRYVSAGILLTGLLFSFARGAWLVALVYGTYLIVTRTKRRFIWGILAVVWTLLVYAIFMHGFQPEIFFMGFSGPLLPKTLIFNDGRLEYWRQAAHAIAEYPLFGSGPGTFYIQSKHFQDTALHYSWYAHNYILELVVEVGFAGTIIIFLLAWQIVQGILHWARGVRGHMDAASSALMWSIFLTVLYSCIEFNLNYMCVWVILWFTAGLLYGRGRFTAQHRLTVFSNAALFYGCALLLGTYIIYSEISTGLVWMNRAEQAYALAPYDGPLVNLYIQQKGVSHTLLTDRDISLIRFFHKYDPEVLLSAATVAPPVQARMLYIDGLKYDPQNSEAQLKYLRVLLEQNDWVGVGPQLQFVIRMNLSKVLSDQVGKINFSDTVMTAHYTQNVTRPLLTARDVAGGIQQFSYMLGLSLMDTHPVITKELWSLAAGISPEWSYFHIELASLDQYVFNDAGAARRDLQYCQKYTRAASHCNAMSHQVLPRPGSFADKIYSISSTSSY